MMTRLPSLRRGMRGCDLDGISSTGLRISGLGEVWHFGGGGDKGGSFFPLCAVFTGVMGQRSGLLRFLHLALCLVETGLELGWAGVLHGEVQVSLFLHTLVASSTCWLLL